jgi:signal transduction histidine kinase
MAATGATARARWRAQDPVRVVALALTLYCCLAMVATAVVEYGNTPYSLNFVRPGDWTIAGALVSVPVVGATLLDIRSRHVTGWLMVASGVASCTGFLCHAIAVRVLLVHGDITLIGQGADWIATWSLVPGLGLIAFVCATWPDGRYPSPWVRPVGLVLAAALAMVTVLQAIADDHLDGVEPEFAPANPLGIRGTEPFADRATFVVSLLLFGFALVTLGWSLVNGARRRIRSGRGIGRRAALVLLVPAAVVVLGQAIGDQEAAGVAVAVSAVGLAVFAVASGIRRAERSERARAALVSQREDERRRLRQDLHDGLGPTLAALRLELDALGAPQETTRARSLLATALGEVRRISRDLRPAALDELGLAGALRHQAAQLSSAAAPGFEVNVPDDLPELGAAVEVALLRIAAEAMTNSARHARAKHCTLVLAVDGDLRLSVEDDGIGTGDVEEGVGLVSMRARAEELGGWCEVTSADGRGTRVVASLPLRAAVR